MNFSNNTSLPPSYINFLLPDYEKLMFKLYQWTGFATMLSNLLVFILFVTDKTLRQRYLYIVRIIGDFINGVNFGYGGFARLKEMSAGTYYNFISQWDCAKKLYSLFQILGTQCPTLVSLFISLERVLAVMAPFWYHAKFGNRQRIMLVLFTILFCVISLTINYATVYPLQAKRIIWGYCPLSFSSNEIYNISHQFFILIVQTSAFLISAFAMIQAKIKKPSCRSYAKRSAKHQANFGSVFIVSGTDHNSTDCSTAASSGGFLFVYQ